MEAQSTQNHVRGTLARRFSVGSFWLGALAAGCETPRVTAELACGSERVLTAEGVGALRVGLPLDSLRRVCEVVSDTVDARGREGSPEHRVVVRIAEDLVEATVENGRISRIAVASPRFRTADSIGVGTGAPALRLGSFQVAIGEGNVALIGENRCGVSFLLEGVEDFPTPTLATLPDSARVRRVLLFGCARSAIGLDSGRV